MATIRKISLLAILAAFIPWVMAQSNEVCVSGSGEVSDAIGCTHHECIPVNPIPTPSATPTPTPSPSPSPTPTALPDNQILARVTDIPNGDPCLGNLYAVIFNDFNNRGAGQNQVALNNCTDNGNGTQNCSGILTVTSGATGLTVYVYCDLSQGQGDYDNNTTSAVTSVNYTNTATFNACARAMNVPPPFNTTFSYALDFPTNTTVANINPPGVSTPNNSGATAGDAFTSLVSDGGNSELVPISDLQVLSGSPHFPDNGTLATWCNCILGQDVSYYSSTYYFSYAYFLIWGGGTIGPTSPFMGYFTDTNQTTTAGNCILP